MLGTEDICFSPDALAMSLSQEHEYSPDHPDRCAMILCFGRSRDQPIGTGARKLALIEAGKQMNHNPTRCIYGGGGDHYSNRAEYRPESGRFEKPWTPHVSEVPVSARVIKFLGP